MGNLTLSAPSFGRGLGWGVGGGGGRCRENQIYLRKKHRRLSITMLHNTLNGFPFLFSMKLHLVQLHTWVTSHFLLHYSDGGGGGGGGGGGKTHTQTRLSGRCQNYLRLTTRRLSFAMRTESVAKILVKMLQKFHYKALPHRSPVQMSAAYEKEGKRRKFTLKNNHKKVENSGVVGDVVKYPPIPGLFLKICFFTELWTQNSFKWPRGQQDKTGNRRINKLTQ